MTRLSNASLSDLAALASSAGERSDHLQLPAYDRGEVTPGIVHFGVGGFHRAHEALYIDRVLELDPSWGIIGVGVREDDRAMRDALKPQDGLYSLTTVDPDEGKSVRIIGSILDFLHAPDSYQEVLEALADPGVRIVSLTITEGGYDIDDVTGEFRPTNPLTIHDLDPDVPAQSVFGLIADALVLRSQHGVPPFTVLSCDNVQHNGRVARTVLSAMVEARHPDLVEWVEENVSTPNSMVDRITPATPPELTDEISAEYGVQDAWPVRAESYLQWVVEDDFPAGAPNWESVGVQSVANVVPYEQMKLRLLNASHQVMSYPAILAGMKWVHDACGDADVEALMRAWMAEARPTLAPVSGVDLDEYEDTLIARFSSPAVLDTLSRQVLGTSDKLPKFLLPVVTENLAAGREPKIGAFLVAAWATWLEGVAQGLYVIEDQRAEVLTTAAQAQLGGEEDALLALTEVFGDLGSDLGFRRLYKAAKKDIDENGIRKAMKTAVQD